tara:strand:+ start:16006 stop:16575 length:570 start_codon:yes stop_codon:yes gene_type:complete
MKKLLKKKIVLIPLVIIILYLVAAMVYYLQFSSDAAAFCDKKFWPYKNSGRRGGDRGITPEEIDSILFKGAAEKGYSVKTTKTGKSCPTCTDGVTDAIYIVTPDRYDEWISDPRDPGPVTEKKDRINEVIKKYEDRIKKCKNKAPSFFSRIIFTFGMLQYVSKVRGGGTYVFAPELFWVTPAAYMSMLP